MSLVRACEGKGGCGRSWLAQQVGSSGEIDHNQLGVALPGPEAVTTERKQEIICASDLSGRKDYCFYPFSCDCNCEASSDASEEGRSTALCVRSEHWLNREFREHNWNDTGCRGNNWHEMLLTQWDVHNLYVTIWYSMVLYGMLRKVLGIALFCIKLNGELVLSMVCVSSWRCVRRRTMEVRSKTLPYLPLCLKC